MDFDECGPVEGAIKGGAVGATIALGIRILLILASSA